MADFNAHINQAIKNCNILKSINKNVPDSWDWQLTTAFYVAVHIVNAHMAKVDNQHYKSHEHIKNALYSGKNVSVPENVYLAYVKLEQLSRRARYLCSEKSGGGNNDNAYLTYELHFARGIRHLDTVLKYFCEEHKINIEKCLLNCNDLKQDKLFYFEHSNIKAA